MGSDSCSFCESMMIARMGFLKVMVADLVCSSKPAGSKCRRYEVTREFAGIEPWSFSFLL